MVQKCQIHLYNFRIISWDILLFLVLIDFSFGTIELKFISFYFQWLILWFFMYPRFLMVFIHKSFPISYISFTKLNILEKTFISFIENWYKAIVQTSYDRFLFWIFSVYIKTHFFQQFFNFQFSFVVFQFKIIPSYSWLFIWLFNQHF